LGLPSSRLISEDEDFYDDLGGDSLDMAEVVMKCEEEFDIEIPDPDSPVRKIGEIIDVAVKCLKKSGPVCS
jgi:acyl carrier protein